MDFHLLMFQIGTLRSQSPVFISHVPITIVSPEAAVEELALPSCKIQNPLLETELDQRLFI